MSRRAPNPAADRAAQNQATIKSLLKLETNKVCADCKRNKHPRWASWNLGVFICIRCSGIHRGMGTHISRVKSVDLDSWTDEQLQSILSWGNARANKYWEAKLATGHAPSESKIENFIRTKYELKRWVMDGPKPDPSTLDVDDDDDVPLSLVKEKQAIERKESIRKQSVGQSQAPRPIRAPEVDLIGGDDPTPRASTASPGIAKIPPKAEPAPPKPTSTKDSLLGLDFLGESSAPPRPASTTGVSTHGTGQSRPDLKQSILSLYATAPKPQVHHQPSHSGSFGGLPSPTMPNQQQGFGGGGITDAFSSLNISGAAPAKPAPADPFASFGSMNTTSRPVGQTNSSSSGLGSLSGGGFFAQKPPQQTHQQKPSSSGLDVFGSFASPAPTNTAPPLAPSRPAQPSSSAMGDLFDLSSPTVTTTTSPPPTNTASIQPPVSSSVFNLSAPQAKPAAPTSSPPNISSNAFGTGGFSGADVWGGNEWNAAEAKPKSPEVSKATTNDFGWGNNFANTPVVPGAGGGFNPAPKVAADEEFGGWASSTTTTNTGTAASSKQGGAGGDDDLFSNVWQ